MNTPTELRDRLTRAHSRCQAGTISQQAYRRIERQVLRDLKTVHRQSYGFAMKQAGAL